MVWVGGTDATYRAALQAPHTVYNRVDVTTRYGVVLQSDLTFIDGSVQATLASRVSRTLSMTVDRSLFPVTSGGDVDTGGLLAPFGNRIKAYRGILYGDGSKAVFPIFYGRIEKIRLTRAGSCTLTANDLAADVVDAAFETPQQSHTANTISQEFVRLVQGALPDAQFGTRDRTAAKIAPLTWEKDRAQALDDMSATVGMLWYPLADGSFVQRYAPWSKSGLTPVLTLSDGTGPTGAAPVLTDWAIEISRTGIYNSVVYTSERQDGSKPVYAIARDTTSGSPTYFLGPFGRKPYLVQNQSALTQAQCLTAAKVTLKQATSVSQTWDNVSIVPDASLELGDLLQTYADGITSQQVVSAFTLPMRETGAMALTLHAYAPVL